MSKNLLIRVLIVAILLAMVLVGCECKPGELLSPDFDILTVEVKINGNASTTTSRNVTLDIRIYDSNGEEVKGIKEMMVANDSSFVGIEWEEFANTKEWMLASTGDTLQYVLIKLKGGKDDNISDIYYDTIYLITPYQMEINNGDSFTLNNTINLNISLKADAIGQNIGSIIISNDSTFTNTTTESISGNGPWTVPHTLIGTDGYRKVYAKLVTTDEIESAVLSDKIYLSTYSTIVALDQQTLHWSQGGEEISVYVNVNHICKLRKLEGIINYNPEHLQVKEIETSADNNLDGNSIFDSAYTSEAFSIDAITGTINLGTTSGSILSDDIESGAVAKITFTTIADYVTGEITVSNVVIYVSPDPTTISYAHSRTFNTKTSSP